MKTVWPITVAVAALILLPSCGLAPLSPPPAPATQAPTPTVAAPFDQWRAEADAALAMATPEQRREQGKRLYQMSCVGCHGYRLQDLSPQTQPQFVRAVLAGSGAMPALAFKLTEAEAEAIRAYLQHCGQTSRGC